MEDAAGGDHGVEKLHVTPAGLCFSSASWPASSARRFTLVSTLMRPPTAFRARASFLDGLRMRCSAPSTWFQQRFLLGVLLAYEAGLERDVIKSVVGGQPRPEVHFINVAVERPSADRNALQTITKENPRVMRSTLKSLRFPQQPCQGYGSLWQMRGGKRFLGAASMEILTQSSGSRESTMAAMHDGATRWSRFQLDASALDVGDYRLKVPIERRLTAGRMRWPKKPCDRRVSTVSQTVLRSSCSPVLMIPESTQWGQAKLQAEVRIGSPIPGHTADPPSAPRCPLEVRPEPFYDRALAQLGAEVIFLVFELVHSPVSLESVHVEQGFLPRAFTTAVYMPQQQGCVDDVRPADKGLFPLPDRRYEILNREQEDPLLSADLPS